MIEDDAIGLLESRGYTVIPPIDMCPRCMRFKEWLPDWTDDQIRTVHWNSAHGRKT